MATTPEIKYPEGRLAPGIYLNLPEKIYHTDPAVGSSDIRTMRKGLHKYWHRSWMNPKREPFDDKMTPSKIMGKAIHKELLEGRKALAEMFVRRAPDAEGASPADKSALTKKYNAQLKDHQFLLKADEFDFVTECGELIKAHPELSTVLDGGLREVSVFWDAQVEIGRDNDDEPIYYTVRCKARFDLLKPRGIGDIKSIANEYDDVLAKACKRAITNYRYPLQAEHYCEGRRQLPALVKAGKIFEGKGVSGNTAAIEYLKVIAAEPRFAFQIIFIPKEGDPDAESWTLSPGNPLLQHEREVIDAVLRSYAHALQAYGTQERWPLVKKVTELTIDELPNWYGVE